MEKNEHEKRISSQSSKNDHRSIFADRFNLGDDAVASHLFRANKPVSLDQIWYEEEEVKEPAITPVEPTAVEERDWLEDSITESDVTEVINILENRNTIDNISELANENENHIQIEKETFDIITQEELQTPSELEDVKVVEINLDSSSHTDEDQTSDLTINDLSKEDQSHLLDEVDQEIMAALDDYEQTMSANLTIVHDQEEEEEEETLQDNTDMPEIVETKSDLTTKEMIEAVTLAEDSATIDNIEEHVEEVVGETVTDSEVSTSDKDAESESGDLSFVNSLVKKSKEKAKKAKPTADTVQTIVTEKVITSTEIEEEKKEKKKKKKKLKAKKAQSKKKAKKAKKIAPIKSDKKTAKAKKKKTTKKVSAHRSVSEGIAYYYPVDTKTEHKKAKASKFSAFTSFLLQLEPLKDSNLRNSEIYKKRKKKKKKKPKSEVLQKAQRSVTMINKIATEPLANLLLQQGHKKEGLAMLHQLSLLYPEKSSYFADRIKNIKAKK